MGMKVQELLSQQQLISAIDKGLKSYENLLGVEKLESIPEYITFCGILTDCQLDNTVCENWEQIQRLWGKMTKAIEKAVE